MKAIVVDKADAATGVFTFARVGLDNKTGLEFHMPNSIQVFGRRV